MTLSDSKAVVKTIKDFLLSDGIEKSLEDNLHMDQFNIVLTIYAKSNTYFYNCPYYLPDSITGAINSAEKNNYSYWWLSKQTGETITYMEIK